MPQSLARVLIHLVFATKNREPFLAGDCRPAVCKYLSGVLTGAGCVPLSVGGMPDHVHLLFALSRTLALCDAVEEVKKQSSVWAKSLAGPGFAWQAGYAAFSVSESNAARVRKYIETQDERHTTLSFQDEFRALLTRNRVEFDERFVWD